MLLGMRSLWDVEAGPPPADVEEGWLSLIGVGRCLLPWLVLAFGGG